MATSIALARSEPIDIGAPVFVPRLAAAML